MATQDTSVPGSGYGNTYIDSLVWGCAWTGGPVSYWFGSGFVPAADSSLDGGAFTGGAWTEAEEDAFEVALAQYSAVCGLEFEEAVDAASADIVWWLAPQSEIGNGVLGMHEVPDESYPQIYGYFNEQHSTWADLSLGSYGYVTVIHELGHGLGLAHPHDGGGEDDATRFPGVTSSSSTGTWGLNQGIWTTMSYNDGWTGAPSPSYGYGYQAGPMAFDIAALQALYGANMTTATGDDTYQLPGANGSGTGFTCIWDAGGASDTISNAGSSTSCSINLNAATLTGSNAAGVVSRASGIYGGFTIANGVTIENATGGSGNDTLVGNAADNILDGGAGNDTMTGGAGNDTYHVQSSRDVVNESAGGGTDTVVASFTFTLRTGVENLVLTGSAALNGTGSSDANSLVGNSGRNQLNGGNGADTLVGGAGVDTLSGGKHADVFIFGDGDSGVGTLRDVIRDFKASESDRIDLSAMDADTVTAGEQAFTFIGGAAFSGAAGQLRFASSILSADLDGDSVADFEIQLSGVRSFTAEVLILG